MIFIFFRRFFFLWYTIFVVVSGFRCKPNGFFFSNFLIIKKICVQVDVHRQREKQWLDRVASCVVCAQLTILSACQVFLQRKRGKKTVWDNASALIVNANMHKSMKEFDCVLLYIHLNIYYLKKRC